MFLSSAIFISDPSVKRVLCPTPERLPPGQSPASFPKWTESPTACRCQGLAKRQNGFAHLTGAFLSPGSFNACLNRLWQSKGAKQFIGYCVAFGESGLRLIVGPRFSASGKPVWQMSRRGNRQDLPTVEIPEIHP